MAFWSKWREPSSGVIPNDNGPADIHAGDPDGVTFEGDVPEARSFPFPQPSPWSGWPSEWATPAFNSQLGLNRLVDTAWSCIDVNSSLMASFPVYTLRSGEIIPSPTWTVNPDPTVYTSWFEFFKQVMWDFHLGEVFVLCMARGADNWPLQFRVVPAWLVNVELVGSRRVYSIGGEDVTGDILHIRYQSTICDAHGHGPLECAGARMTTIGLLERYTHTLMETGGVPQYWLEIEKTLKPNEAAALLDDWVTSRKRRLGEPALLSGGASLHDTKTMSAKDLTLLELSQFTEARIAILLGVPPFLQGLPSGSDSLTYQNVESLFSYHDRASLRWKASAVMSALSGFLLPRGQSLELNRDEYSRPPFKERAEAYKILVDMGAMSIDEVRDMERLHGDIAAASLAGVGSPQAAPTAPPQPVPITGGSNGSVG